MNDSSKLVLESPVIGLTLGCVRWPRGTPRGPEPPPPPVVVVDVTEVAVPLPDGPVAVDWLPWAPASTASPRPAPAAASATITDRTFTASSSDRGFTSRSLALGDARLGRPL